MNAALALPRRQDAWEAILAASGIDDHDYKVADRLFRLFINDRRSNRQPPPWEGGEFDSINGWLGLSPGHRVTGALHAFYLLSRTAQRWPDLIPVVAMLRAVPGLGSLRLPDDVTGAIASEVSYWRDVERLYTDGGAAAVPF